MSGRAPQAPRAPRAAGPQRAAGRADAPPKTVMECVRAARGYLEAKGVDEARLNAEHLLAHALGMKRLDLYLRFDRPVSEAELARCRPLLRRRGAREPLQYVLGTAPFRELELRVDPRVAIPRPETEHLLDVLDRVARAPRGAANGRAAPNAGPPGSGTGGPASSPRAFDRALDVGTGSGAIAISLAREGRARSVTATDVSPEALVVASRNASECGCGGIRFLRGSLLEPVAGRSFDLILSNPPYLDEAEWGASDPEVREWEPRRAMVADEGGLALIRELAAGVARALRPGGWFGVEVGHRQADAVAAMLEASPGLGPPSVHRDLFGHRRYVLVQRPASCAG